ncbi:MAG: hydantoinase/oxoprolinase family protein [Actinomycetes bacterium]
MSSTLAFGVDIGGTFTDAVIVEAGRAWRGKAPTTHDDLTEGVLAACRLAADARGEALGSLLSRAGRFGLGTTVVTNTVAARRGRTVGLLTTAGFEELLPLARGRLVLSEGWLSPPDQLVPRERIVGIEERIDRRGAVLRPLVLDDVVDAARDLVSGGVEAIAVSFLWSFANPTHELAAVEAIQEALPDVPVVAGSSLHPAIREYERTMVAVLNAYTGGALAGVDRLVDELTRAGLSVPLLLVHSGGGAIGLDEARAVPITLVESGPAAGVSAATSLGARIGARQLVTCDMGGTSIDVAVIADGEPARRSRGELMGFWTAVPLVDIESIGAGGGSVARADARGMLQVGPDSTGSWPGPACYGRGGTQPTVTDALVVLGYLDPARFLGGHMPLDPDAARAACAGLGAQLGLDAHEVAWGIRELTVARMARMIRARLATRGVDPAAFSLLAFGGGGGLFAPSAAIAAGLAQVLVPELASVLSAVGAATAGVRRERVRSVSLPVPVDADVVGKFAAELTALAQADLAADGVDAEHACVTLEADLRFKRQTAELTVALDDDYVQRFRDEYVARYGTGALARQAPIELVTIRAIGTGPEIDGPRAVMAPPVADAAASATRLVHVERYGEPLRVPFVRIDDLSEGDDVDGPALIDGNDTTIWVPPQTTACVDAARTLVIEARS